MKKFKKRLEPFVAVYLEILKLESSLSLDERSDRIKALISSLSVSDLKKLYEIHESFSDEEDWLDPVTYPPEPLEPVLAVMETGVGLKVVEAWKIKGGSWNFKSAGNAIPYGSPIVYKPWPRVPKNLIDNDL